MPAERKILPDYPLPERTAESVEESDDAFRKFLINDGFFSYLPASKQGLNMPLPDEKTVELRDIIEECWDSELEAIMFRFWSSRQKNNQFEFMSAARDLSDWISTYAFERCKICAYDEHGVKAHVR